MFPLAVWIRAFFSRSRFARVLVGPVLLFAAFVTSAFWIAVAVLVLKGSCVR